MTSLQRQVSPAPQLYRLKRRFLVGGLVRLADVFRAAGLAQAERHVIAERLAGRSYGQIAGRSCTRQRVHQVERVAVARLRLSLSIAQAVHAVERIDNGRVKAQQADAVRPCELHADDTTPARRLSKPTARQLIERRLDRLADRWIKADDLTTRVALRAEAERLGQQLAAV
jgi:hypothetical protein